MKTIFGATIDNERSYRKKDALKMRNSLFPLKSSRSIEGLESTRKYLRSKDIPYIVVYDKNSFKPFIILKRQWVYDKDAGRYRVKGCECNPISRDGCIKCRPNISAKNLRKRLNSDGKKWRTGRSPGRPKI